MQSMWLKPMKRTKRKRIQNNQQNKLDFKTSPKECSFTNKYKNKTLRQDIVSLKQTKNFKRYIDAYPLVGTGGGGKIKNKILRQDIVSLKQTKNKEILS